MKVLIFGGEGFIGSSLLKTMRKKVIEVSSSSRRSGCNLLDINSTIKHIKEKKPEIIINCAAHHGSVHYGMKIPAIIFYENMTMILNIFKATADVSPESTIINPIPNCVYPMDYHILKEHDLWKGMPHPTALPYAATKRMIQVLSKCYYEQFGINSKNLIIPGIYGPGDHIDIDRVHVLQGLIIRMIKAKNQNQDEFEIWGSGKPIREHCYIDDLIELIIKSIEIKDLLIDPVNIGQNKGQSVNELAQMTAKALGYKGKLTYNTNYPDGAAAKILDDTRFKKIFGSFNFTNIEIGFKKTVEYYLQKLQIRK